ncbi:MAG TPA: hypothetical protein GX005_02915 [Bacteroidales bacterium]|nr:hypothetical protein [Bacteroidales bacterium]
MKRLFYLILIVFVLSSCDKEKNYLRQGNKNFEQKDYSKAEDNYLKALNIDSTYHKAQFNLANSNYKKNKEDQLNKAIMYYEKALTQDLLDNDSSFLSDILYNRGNTNFKLALLDSIEKTEKYDKGLKKAIEDYKGTLKINSKDSSAKYNLSLAMRLLEQNKNQNQNQDKQDKDKRENKDQDKQKQENKKDQDKKKQEESSPQNYNKKENQDKERMLEALKNNEKNTLERLKKEKDKNTQQIRNDKDW